MSRGFHFHLPTETCGAAEPPAPAGTRAGGLRGGFVGAQGPPHQAVPGAGPHSLWAANITWLCSLRGAVWMSIFSCPHFLSSLTFMNFRCLSLSASEGCCAEICGGPCTALRAPMKWHKGQAPGLWLQPGCGATGAHLAGGCWGVLGVLGGAGGAGGCCGTTGIAVMLPSSNRRVGLLSVLRLLEGAREGDDWEW